VPAYVLDASMLAALYVDDPATKQSEAALQRIQNDELHAPDFVVLEVANVLWKRVRREELTPHEIASQRASRRLVRQRSPER
jgi:predicted nucleic acid-binding protein